MGGYGKAPVIQGFCHSWFAIREDTSKHFLKAFFVDNPYPYSLGLIKFGSRLFASHHIVCFLAHRGGNTSAMLLDKLSSLIASQSWQLAGQNKLHSLKSRRPLFAAFAFQVNAGALQLLDDFAISVL